MTGASLLTGGLVAGGVPGGVQEITLPVITGSGDWGDRGNAIRLWLIAATELASAKVIWAEQDGPRPAVPFLEVRLGDLIPLGAVDGTSEDVDEDAGAGEEIVQTVHGQREFIVTVRAFTASAVGNGSARSLLSRCQTALGLTEISDILALGGLTCFDNGRVQPVPRILDTKWEGNATLTVRFYVEEQAQTKTGYFHTVELQGTVPPANERTTTLVLEEED